MKRWLLGFFLVIAFAAPSLALAYAGHGPGWEPPGRLPISGLPSQDAGSTAPAYDTAALVGARYLGLARLGNLNVNVVMTLRDEQGLLRYASVVNNPHSLYYRRFLTPQQLGDFFGVSQTDYARAIRYFWAYGLGVQWWSQRQMLRVVGPQASVERALGTRFGFFKKNGVVFYAPISAPVLAAPLAVRAIGGIVTYRHLRKHFDVGAPMRPFTGVGAGFLVGYSPFDLASAFDYAGAYNLNSSCCKGDGITIGIIGTGGIAANDVPFFRATFGVKGSGAVKQVNVNQVFTACCYSNGLAAPPPVTNPASPACLRGQGLPSCNPEDVEAQLDTEQSSSLAPNALVNFYLAYNPNECYTPGTCAPGAGAPQLGIHLFDDELQQIVHDNKADVVSGSVGIGELDFAGQSGGLLNSDGSGFEPDVFASMAAEGMAVFFSSGDTGAAGCQRDGPPGFPNADVLCVSYPSDDVNIVSVGGTTTPIGSDGRLTGLVTTWGVQTLTGGAGGGGFSVNILRPAFEPIGTFCADNGACDSSHRLQPDVSLNADPVTGPSVIIDSTAALGGPLIGLIGGTSASAPDMAAMWALVLEACKQTTSCNTGPAGHTYRLGNPAPLLYGLSASQKASAFYDIVYGNNAVPLSTVGNYSSVTPGFNAGTGWDAATGLGAPFARNLIKAIVGI